MTKQDEIELKPCPFCGITPVYSPDPSEVFCHLCCYSIEDDCKQSAIEKWNLRATQELVPLEFNKLWIEFEKFLEPYTSDEIIQPIYARNTIHIKNWLKSVCDRFGQRGVPSVEEIRKIINKSRDQFEYIDVDHASKSIHQMLKEGK